MDDDKAKRLNQFAQHFFRTRLSSATNVFVVPRIPRRKLARARRRFIDPQDGDVVLVLYDDTVFGSAKSGFAITDKALVYNLPLSATETSKIKSAFKLEDIQTIDFDKHFLTCDVIVNGRQLFNATSLSRKDAMALQRFFDHMLANDLDVPSDEVAPATANDRRQISREFLLDLATTCNADVGHMHELDYLPSVLRLGEHPVALTRAELRSRTWLVTVTDARVILLEAKLTGALREQVIARLDRVEDVTADAERRSITMTLDDRRVHLSDIQDDAFEPFWSRLQTTLQAHRDRNIPYR